MSFVREFTDVQADRLRSFLCAAERPEGTLRYLELAGFLFVISCSPEMVMPSEWIPLIFDGKDPGYESTEVAQEVLSAVMALYNHINRGVVEGCPELPPGCALDDNGIANLDPDASVGEWARGFVEGHGYLEDLWSLCAPDVLAEELVVCLAVLGFFSSRKVADGYCKGFKPGEMTLEEMAQKMADVFPEAMKRYAHLGRSIHRALLEYRYESQQPVRSTKIGRNEPCPCGSGRKYKKCCASSAD